MQASSTVITSPRNKYNIGEKAYIFNIHMATPLVMDFVIKGIISNDEGLFYNHDNGSQWVKEDYLYRTRKEAYKALIAQAENELQQPESFQK